MATDFLKSNLFTPVSFSKTLLKKTRWRMAKVNNGKSQSLNKRNHQTLNDSRESINSNVLDHSFQYNTTANHYSDISNRGTGASNFIHNNGSKSSYFIRSMLTSIFANGLVRISKPVNNPRQIRSSNSKSSCTLRRQRVRRCVSQTVPPEANLFAGEGEEEPTLQRAHLQKHFIQKHSLDRLYQQHFEDPVENLNITESSPKQDVHEQQYTSQKDTLTMMYPNTQRNILPCLDNVSVNFCTQDFSRRYTPENLIHKIIADDPNPWIIDGVIDNSSSVDPHRNYENGDVNIQSSDRIQKYGALDDKANLLQLQAEFDLMSLTTKKGDKCQIKNCSFDKTSQRSYTETFKDHFTCSKVRELPTVDQSANPKESVDNHKNNYISTASNITSKKSSSKRKHFQHVLKILFDMRWKWKKKKDDEKPLVEEEITGENINRQHRTPKKDKVKKWSCKQIVVKRKMILVNKWRLLSETKATIPTNQSTVTRRKTKQQRKKTVYRARRQLRRNLGRGCRNIGYGFSYLVAEIPESPYMGRPNDSKNLSGEEYNHNNHYKPIAPAPNCRKKRFLTADVF